MSSVFVQRQVGFQLFTGQLTSLRDGVDARQTMRDVLPKYVLKLDQKNIVAGYLARAQNTSNAFDLPPGYTSANRLSGIITVNARAKVTLVSPTFGTSSTLLYGTKSATDGNHRGIHAFCCDVTSVTLVIPPTAQGGEDTLIEYIFWQLPDLTLASSWRDGAISLGVEP